VVEGGLGEENLAGVGHEGKAFGSLEAVAFGDVGCDFAAADAAYNGVSRGDAAGDSRDVAAFSNAVFADASEASGLLECGFEDAQGVVGMIARRTCETRAECGVGREERASVCEKGLCGFLEKSAGDEAVLEGRNFSSKRGGRFHAGGTAGDETQVGNSHSAEFLFAEFLKWRAGHRREEVLDGFSIGDFIKKDVGDTFSGGGFEFENAAIGIGKEAVRRGGCERVCEEVRDLSACECRKIT
jgi:hypothetical protein